MKMGEEIKLLLKYQHFDNDKLQLSSHKLMYESIKLKYKSPLDFGFISKFEYLSWISTIKMGICFFSERHSFWWFFSNSSRKFPRKGEEAFEKGIDISIDFPDQELILSGCLFSVRQQEKISFYSFLIGFAQNEKITFVKSNFISKHILSFAF
jgi:hypothetical protein